MKSFIWLAFILVGLMPAVAMSHDKGDGIPVSAVPEKYKDYKWHRFETTNFEILAINQAQGASLVEVVEKLKSWINVRWGLKDDPYDKKCMILCFSDAKMFSECFPGKGDITPKVSKSKTMEGADREVYAIWIAGEAGFESSVLPEKIARINWLAYEHMHNTKLPYWMHVGMSALCNDTKSLRNSLTALDPSASYVSDKVFSFTPEMDVVKDGVKVQSAAMCLFLRKQQYGQRKFSEMMSNPSNKSHVFSAFGFSDQADFDLHYNSYVRYLSHDIRAGVTPDMGLTWLVKKSDLPK